jgi:hypothetical protein
VVRAPRPPSLASEYLMEAIESLHAAGDAGHLFAFWRQHPPSDLRRATKDDPGRSAHAPACCS